jgi:xylulokinase
MDHARDLMAEIGLNETQFPAIVRPGEVMGEVTETASRTTGLWAGTPVVAGGGDGQCAGTGVNVFAPGRAYVNMGTALVSGTYSRTYGINHAFRTMGAVSDEGYIFESVNRTGTFLVDWILRELFNADPRLEATLFKTLESEAALAGVGAGGMVLVPYWSGVMTPYWRSEARGIIAGLNASHKRGHIYRAMLDGLSLEQALSTDKAAAAVGSPIDHYVAIGGGSTSDLWCSILADASGRTVVRSSTVEASSLGAAMAAAKGAGWYTTIENAAASMAGEETRRFVPEEKTAKRYRALMAIYADLWPLLANWNARLAAFADESVE